MLRFFLTVSSDKSGIGAAWVDPDKGGRAENLDAQGVVRERQVKEKMLQSQRKEAYA